MVSYYLLTENIIEMTELETQIWNTVHNWCDAQSNEIPDQNRRYLMDEIKALVLSHVSERFTRQDMITDKEYKDLMKALYPKDNSKRFSR